MGVLQNLNNVPERFGLDLIWYRTPDEMELAHTLLDVTDEHLATWSIDDDSELDVSDDIYTSKRPQLCARFLYFQRLSGGVDRGKIYWNDKVQQLHRCLSMRGYAVPYQRLTAYQFQCEKGA